VIPTVEAVRTELRERRDDAERYRNWLDDDLPPVDAVNTNHRLFLALRGLGLCEALLGAADAAAEQFAAAAAANGRLVDAIQEHSDAVAGSWAAERPTTLKEGLSVAVLSGETDAIEAAARRTRRFDADAYLDRWGVDRHGHVLYYVRVLAAVLTSDEGAGAAVARLADLDHRYDLYDALEASLEGLLGRAVGRTHDGLETVLEWHDAEYGADPSTPVEWVCVDATVLLRLARRQAIALGPADFEPARRAYLPTALFEDA